MDICLWCIFNPNTWCCNLLLNKMFKMCSLQNAMPRLVWPLMVRYVKLISSP
ncbi:unnamed protein product [Callosobruchus maculatus]|uniref:Uncharacterized protein n=1 Tax=Callosobruchus maculatus TaxID=64391 RepID=A0A653CAA9_CALMS|nr:unnamed protein product [Callosobruchus maculatus]